MKNFYCTGLKIWLYKVIKYKQMGRCGFLCLALVGADTQTALQKSFVSILPTYRKLKPISLAIIYKALQKNYFAGTVPMKGQVEPYGLPWKKFDPLLL